MPFTATARPIPADGQALRSAALTNVICLSLPVYNQAVPLIAPLLRQGCDCGHISETLSLDLHVFPEAIRRLVGQADALSMPNYRYKVGEKVFIRGAARIDAPSGAYQVLQRLQSQNDPPRYLIMSLQDHSYKTIVDEKDLA